ncbi:MAG: helix-turn-helix transcriptional regulator [Jejuia sp.]
MITENFMNKFHIHYSLWKRTLFFLLVCPYFSAQNIDYTRFVDSADAHTNKDSKLAKQFLDSIPEPIKDFIPGHLAHYYHIKSIIHNFNYENSEYQQCTILALKYAKIENKPCIAGQSCSNLASEFFHVGKDSMAYKYLDIAESYFLKCNEEPYGVVEVETMRAYSKLTNGLYNEAIDLVEPRFKFYTSITEDKYYHAFASFMLANSYIHLDKLDKGHYYHKELHKLRNAPKVLNYNFLSFDVNVNFLFARAHFRKKNVDSTLYYLDKCRNYTDFMGATVTRKYFKTYSEVYESQGNLELTKIYLDSLVNFEDSQYYKSVNANIKISDTLLKAEAEIQDKNIVQSKYKFVLSLLAIALLLFGALYYFYVKSNKKRLKFLESKTSNLDYLKSNNQELSFKVKYLEDYIKNLRNEIKKIAQIKCLEDQKDEIKILYKDLRINSSTILEKSESHLDLINDLNINFFKKIETLYPNLSKSEIIICYYIVMGFTNKEISAFLNTSIRSIESKRYRISKKIDFDRKNKTIVDHLKETFSDTLPVYQLN